MYGSRCSGETCVAGAVAIGAGRADASLGWKFGMTDSRWSMCRRSADPRARASTPDLERENSCTLQTEPRCDCSLRFCWPP